MTPWLRIVGIGEDGVDGLSVRARRAIGGAALVVGGARHLALADPLIAGERLAWPSPIEAAFPAIIARHGEPVVVLASGDPSFYGIATTLAAVVPAAETEIVPAPSSVSLACARLGWAVQDVAVVSSCGRPLAAIRPHLHDGARLIVLSADATTPAVLAVMLEMLGFGASRLRVMERLGGPHERVTDSVPSDVAALNLVAVEVQGSKPVSLAAGRPDELFEHDGQITKSEIRAMTLAALAPSPGALLWDVGCGSGAVGIEWSLAHPACRAIGIEADATRADRAARNAVALGVPSLRVVRGAAPDALAGLPTPDAVFVGGGAEDGVLDVAWAALRPGGKFVANAVLAETEVRLFEAFTRHGGSLTRLSVERLGVLGGGHGFLPARPITQWAATK